MKSDSAVLAEHLRAEDRDDVGPLCEISLEQTCNLMRPGPLRPPALFQAQMSLGRRRHRAVLPHLGNHTAAIEFGCLKAGMRIRDRNRTTVVKMIIGLATVARLSQSPQQCVHPLSKIGSQQQHRSRCARWVTAGTRESGNKKGLTVRSYWWTTQTATESEQMVR
jgi:hypothetical protein